MKECLCIKKEAWNNEKVKISKAEFLAVGEAC